MSNDTPVSQYEKLKARRAIEEPTVVENSCKSCLKLGSCWLVVSVKGALANHQAVMGVTMFDWPELAKVCTEYRYTDDRLRIITDTNLEA